MTRFQKLVLVAISSALLVTGSAWAAPEMADKKAATSTTKKALIDINSASQADLDALPGIGPAYAKKIIDGRPYKGKDELVQKKILPASKYNAIKAMIIAKQ